MKSYTVGLFVLTSACSFGQAMASIAGTWVLDKVSLAKFPSFASVHIRFGKDGSVSIKGVNIRGSGSYTLVGNKLTLILTKRNGGRPTAPSERIGHGTVTAGGKLILLESGAYRGKTPEMLRLIRRK